MYLDTALIVTYQIIHLQNWTNVKFIVQQQYGTLHTILPSANMVPSSLFDAQTFLDGTHNMTFSHQDKVILLADGNMAQHIIQMIRHISPLSHPIILVIDVDDSKEEILASVDIEDRILLLTQSSTSNISHSLPLYINDGSYPWYKHCGYGYDNGTLVWTLPSYNLDTMWLVGRTLKTLSLPYEPGTIRTNGEWSGTCFDLMNEIAMIIGFNFTVELPLDGAWGVYLDNTWNGMIKMLLKEEADFGIGGFTINSQRQQALPFSETLWEEPATFVVHTPVDQTVMLYLKPFKLHVWLSIILCSIVVSVVLYLFTRILYTEHPLSGIQSALVWVYAMQMQQGLPFDIKHTSLRAVISMRFMFCVVIITVYSGTMMAYFTVIDAKVPVNSLEELYDSDYNVYVTLGASTQQLLQNSPALIYQQIWSRVEDTKDGLKSWNQCLQTVEENERTAFITEYTRLDYMTRMNCDLVVTDARFFKANIGLPFKRSFPYVDTFNDIIMRMKEGGFFARWKQMYYIGSPTCDRSARLSSKRVTLSDITGVVIVLVMGLFISLVIMLLECTVNQKYPNMDRYEQ